MHKQLKLGEKLKNSKKIKLINKGKDLNNIIDIGDKISKSVSIFFQNQKLTDPTKDFAWEYILIDNKNIKNAWCMPGGKIAVYTGILDVTKNINGLAAVMGHEIAHAVAKHSVERMSAAMAVNVTTQIADIITEEKYLKHVIQSVEQQVWISSARYYESVWKKTRE